MTLEQAQERIAELERLLGAGTVFEPLLSLSPAEKSVAGVLLVRGGASTETLVGVMYGERPDGGPEYARRCAWMVVHALRKKLKPHGVRIATIRHQGYLMDEQNRVRLRALISGRP